MPESKIIAQGAYGCVYYPGYSCDGSIQTKKYVSKLSRDDKDAQREYDIGKIVQTIVNYQKKFIVIEKKCKIKKIQKKHKDCSLVKKNENYVLLYSSYLDSIMLSSLLTDYSIDYYKLLQISKTLVNRIHDLAHANVVHMDLHFGNILWSKKNKSLYVIDMGLALDMNKFYINKKLNFAYLKNNLFHYNPDWPSWTIEYNLLAYMIHENMNINDELLLSCIQRYYEKHIQKELYDKEEYIGETYNFFKPLLKNTITQNITILLGYANSWDYYKVSFHFLSYMKRKNIYFQELKLLLLLMIHPIPTFRPSSNELKQSFSLFIDIYKDEYSSYKILAHEDAGLVEDLMFSAKRNIPKYENYIILKQK
jgi:hypothetical protein